MSNQIAELVKVAERIAESIENQSRSVIQGFPPEALSIVDSARFLGVDVPAVEYLIKTRQLPYIQYGKQRGRMILVEDLRHFLKKHRVSSGEEMLDKRRRA